MIELCGISYQLPQPTAVYDRAYIIEDSDTDTHCLAAIKRDKLILAFRGTNSVKNFMNDIKFIKKAVPYDNPQSKIRVHSGFINAYKSDKIRGRIIKIVGADPQIKRIRVTGHSLGAALATLCAVDLQYNFPDRDYEVILFGSPRVGNCAFKKSYDKRIFKTMRIKNRGDIITELPFAFMGYRHVGAQIVLPRRGLMLPLISHSAYKYYSNTLEF